VFGLSFATVLTLIVTPSMLMVFTREKRKRRRRRNWFSRLFRRGKRIEEPAGTPQAPDAEPAIPFPKAAE
jgi:multidrug efflux pump